MTHPLTDEICKTVGDSMIVFDGFPDAHDHMRAGADWQLEQDAKYFAQYLIKHCGFALHPELAEERAQWFKEEMRPQQQENN